jgi:hypothetical protein
MVGAIFLGFSIRSERGVVAICRSISFAIEFEDLVLSGSAAEIPEGDEISHAVMDGAESAVHRSTRAAKDQHCAACVLLEDPDVLVAHRAVSSPSYNLRRLLRTRSKSKKLDERFARNVIFVTLISGYAENIGLLLFRQRRVIEALRIVLSAGNSSA